MEKKLFQTEKDWEDHKKSYDKLSYHKLIVSVSPESFPCIGVFMESNLTINWDCTDFKAFIYPSDFSKTS